MVASWQEALAEHGCSAIAIRLLVGCLHALAVPVSVTVEHVVHAIADTAVCVCRDSETAHVAETPSRPGAPACVVDIAHPYDDAEDARGLQEEIVKWRKMAAIHAFLQHFTAFQQGFPEVLDCKCVDTYRLEAAAWGLADDSSDDEDRSGPPLSRYH